MDFDAVLEKCGGFHRYQLVLLLLFATMSILSSLHYFAQTIISFTPEHWCYHESLENRTISEVRQIYAPSRRPGCTTLEALMANQTAQSVDFPVATSCSKYIYNYDRGYESISTELNWVCGKGYQLAVGQSLFFVGSVCGTVFFGFLADRLGRLPALILAAITGGIGDFLTSFVRTPTGFAACRFIGGLSTDSMYYMMYILVFEYLSPTRRTFGLNIVQLVFYTLGLFSSPFLAQWMGNWRSYMWLASLPILCTLIYPVFLCESALWLISRGNIKGAVQSLQRVALFNRRPVPDQTFAKMEAFYEQKLLEEKKLGTGKDTFLGMFRTPRMRKFSIILLLKSMIITMSYDISSRNVEGLGSSPFKLFAYSSLTYVPAGLTIIWLQRYIGRKGMACGSLLVGGVITAVTGSLIAFLDHNENALLLALMVALVRYGSIVAYDAEVQYAAELIPSSVRGQGVANIHVIGYAFNSLSSYILYLSVYFKPLPSLVVSALMLTGAVLCLLLPETMDKKLPETLADGEEFGRGEQWHYFPCLGKRKEVEPDVQVTKL